MSLNVIDRNDEICPICGVMSGIGLVEDFSDTVLDGELVSLPVRWHICGSCGSEFTTKEDVDFNLKQIKIIKENIRNG